MSNNKVKMIFNFKFSIFNSQAGLSANGFADRRWQAGQAVLIIVLILVVGLTVGLAVASRSITNVRISTEEENSQRAFSAAEAGIEKALKTTCPPTCTLDSQFSSDTNASFSTTISNIQGDTMVINGGSTVVRDDGIDIWLVDHDPTTKVPIYTTPWLGKLTVYWGNIADTECNTAAIEIVVISNTTALPKSTRYAYDPCLARRSVNNLSNNLVSASGETISGQNFKFKINPPIDTVTPGGNSYQGFIARVIPLYKDTIIGVKATAADGTTPLNLPSQGFRVNSTGTSGQTQRKINYYQGYAGLPSEFFPYIRFSTR